MARTEFALAQKLRPRKVSDFPSTEHLRRDLIESIAEYRREQSQVLIGEFNPATFSADGVVLSPDRRRLAGRKGARPGLHPPPVASAAHRPPLSRRSHRRAGDAGADHRNLRQLPRATMICSTSPCTATDDARDRAPLPGRARFPIALIDKLLGFLQEVHYPLAVRSSSLLEDSQYQPFSGVYETFMLANQNPDIQLRLEQLLEAIKLVYASTFSQHAKAYVRATPYRLEEEKMAVVLQQVVGATHGRRFYPDFSGVVRSRNFYPHPPMRVEDGFAAVALGLGRAVVGGGKCLTFSPRYPQNLVQFSSVEDMLANSQTEFWALELEHAVARPAIVRPICARFRSGSTSPKPTAPCRCSGSTYSADNHAVYDGLSRRGAAHRELRAYPQARPVSAARHSRPAHAHRRRRVGPSGGDRVRRPPAAASR